MLSNAFWIKLSQWAKQYKYITNFDKYQWNVRCTIALEVHFLMRWMGLFPFSLHRTHIIYYLMRQVSTLVLFLFFTCLDVSSDLALIISWCGGKEFVIVSLNFFWIIGQKSIDLSLGIILMISWQLISSLFNIFKSQRIAIAWFTEELLVSY